MKTTVLALLVGVMLAIGGSVATAGPFEDASAAYERGDYATAVRLLKQLADQGHASAQLYLGRMYEFGWGVPQDAAEAAKWYRKAADQNSELTGEAPAQQSPPASAPKVNVLQWSPSASAVSMVLQGGTYRVPVLINGAMTLDFIVDSGASHVTIPADVVRTLMRTGALKSSDFFGEQTYMQADGSKVSSQTFRIRSLKVGNNVIENVTASVTPPQGFLLLGQSFLERFKSWSIDNAKHELVLVVQ